MEKFIIIPQDTEIVSKLSKSNIDLEEIKKLYYEDNLSLIELAKNYNVDRGTIVRYLKKNNCEIKKRGNNGIGEVKHNPFLPYNEHSYYWIGYLAADGYITKDESRGMIGVSSKDIDHMTEYLKFINANINPRDIINVAGSTIRVVEFSNKSVKDFLISIGITSNKSKTLKFNIPINRDILRGLFDGDGNVSKNTGVKITTASLNLIEQLEDFVKKELPFIRSVVVKKSETTFDFYFRGKLELLYHYLYDNSTIYLERKKQTMQEAFSSDTN